MARISYDCEHSGKLLMRTLAGLRSGKPTWTRSSLPITVVSQVIEGPDGNLYAATFGR